MNSASQRKMANHGTILRKQLSHAFLHLVEQFVHRVQLVCRVFLSFSAAQFRKLHRQEKMTHSKEKEFGSGNKHQSSHYAIKLSVRLFVCFSSFKKDSLDSSNTYMRKNEKLIQTFF